MGNRVPCHENSARSKSAPVTKLSKNCWAGTDWTTRLIHTAWSWLLMRADSCGASAELSGIKSRIDSGWPLRVRTPPDEEPDEEPEDFQPSWSRRAAAWVALGDAKSPAF